MSPRSHEKPKAYKQRITANTLFGIKGSATGEESKKLLAAKHEESRAEKEGKAARNEERNQAKALKVAREVTRGAEVMKALELFGTQKLNNLTLPDLPVAPVTNVNPQGNETKPKNKSEAMLRARALSSVHADLSRYDLAIAIGFDPVPLANAHAHVLAPAPLILSQLQSLFPSEEYIKGLRLSYGSSGVVEQHTALVGHDAP